MMLRPLTVWPSLLMCTSASKRLVVWTRSAAARAWRPRRFTISRLAWCSSAAPAMTVSARAAAARGRLGRPEDVLLAVPLDEAREAAGVHLPARRGELHEDRPVDAGHPPPPPPPP